MAAVVRRVNVVPNDIRGGKRGSSCGCPLGSALNRVIPYGIRVAVAKDSFTVLGVDRDPHPASVRIPLPGWVAEVVDRYDKTGSMPLFSYDQEFPEL